MMYGFGKAANRWTGLALIVAVLLVAGTCLAQTPDESCAADSLYLVSPEAVDLRYDNNDTTKVGVTISWPNLDPALATCYSISDTVGLGYTVSVTGGFQDQVDRVFRFNSQSSGTVGGQGESNLILTWQNEGPARYGTIGGRLNLSNNGGFWRSNANAGVWEQVNAGLPMTWEFMNVVAADRGPGGFMLSAFSRGTSTRFGAVGVFAFDGSTWSRIGEDYFNASTFANTVAVSPTDQDVFLVGTTRDGLFITRDGGQTFTQWRSEFDPGYDDLPANFRVQALDWSGDRIYVFIQGLGLFTSLDEGVSFSRSLIEVPENLDVEEADRNYILPTANSIFQDPVDPDRALISLEFHGAYETTDGGQSWHDLYGDLVVPDDDPLSTGTWIHSATSTVAVEGSPQTLVMGVKQRGIFRTVDGGTTWTQVAPELTPDNPATIPYVSVVNLPGLPGSVICLVDNIELGSSTDGGATWTVVADGPALKKGVALLAGDAGTGDYLVATYGGGIYEPGEALRLTDTYTAGLTSPELMSLDLGLSIYFSAGDHMLSDEFRLICQTVQGWAVWRGASYDPDEMTMLGLYDNVNPEDCYRGYCGDNSLEVVPNCYAAKRAACFDLSDPDTLRFFDEEVYNGFEYVYAVTSFDYGNTARLTPENNTRDMLFSARFADDPETIYPGDGNREMIRINADPVTPATEEEIYVYPNPVRLGAGLPRAEGGAVVFTNVPEGSRVLVFTTAGDKVVELAPEGIQGRNLFWDTNNDSGEEIAAGVYLYKVEMTQREDYWGRLVVIR